MFQGTAFCAEMPDRSNISDWYIKDFSTEIIVDLDRSLNIVENIVADCGNLSGKHGIFRIVPKSIERAGKVISLPVNLVSITDFQGNLYVYDANFDFFNNTKVWKIGDPEKTVHGVNNYKINYVVKNAVYTLGENYDELYWNVLGSFWELEIDNFTAKIVLPEGLNRENTQVKVFSGDLGVEDNLLADFDWISDNSLEVRAGVLMKNQGLTVSLQFPKGVIEVEKKFDFLSKLVYLFFLLPLIAFVICYKLWLKNGKDFNLNKSIMPEYYPPKDLSLLEIGAILNNGKIKNEYLSSEIINLAVKGLLTIEQVKVFWIFGKTYVFKATGKDTKSLNLVELGIYNGIFGAKSEVRLLEIKTSFFESYKGIKDDVLSGLDVKDLFNKKSLTIQKIFLGLAFFFIFDAIILLSLYFSINVAYQHFVLVLMISIVLMGPIFLFFGIFMAQRTRKGEEVLNQILGFKMYMSLAEIDRQKFNEKENIFEKYLPYAIAFGITKLWIKKFKTLYGEQFYTSYTPLWLIGNNIDFSNVSAFNGLVSSISSDIGGSLGSSTSSGGGGGGSSGGGGGGGGGGGW